MKIEIGYNGISKQLFVEKKPTLLKICPNYSIEKGFNTVAISLDASLSSLLNWKDSIEKAKEFKEKGFWLIWEFDFSLESLSFFDSASLMTLEFAVEEFVKSLWPLFQDVSIGVIVYHGQIENWQKHHEKLQLLASRFSEETSLFVMLDTSEIEKRADYFLQTRQDLFSHFLPILKGKWTEAYPSAFPALGWNHNLSPLGFFADVYLSEKESLQKHSFAIHLPDQVESETLEQMLRIFAEKNFRLIPDAMLTQEWEGIDELLLLSADVGERTKRKLLGFCAAGGRVISQKFIGLPGEILLSDYLNTN